MKSLNECQLLLVDDVKSNIDVLVEGLRDHYRLSIALDGQTALQSVQRRPPDLILLDIMMPGMDGLEVCRRLKEDPATREIPVMFLTAMNELEHKTAGFEAGGADYVTKPFEMLEVKARVRALLKSKIYNDYILDYQQILQDEVARRTRELEEARDQISKSFIETVFRLAIAAEFKDTDTGAHILRIGHLAAATARRLEQDEDFAQSLVYAAPLHDIGKIGVPDAVLLKPGKLNDDEWQVMRKHTVYGGMILQGSRSKIINLGKIIAMTHHEKWDGSGYPNGLAGEVIPLSGRITAVVDVFDALVSTRCYKDPIPRDKALEILKQGSATHFDPEVVGAFLDNMHENDQIRLRFNQDGMNVIAEYFSSVLDNPLEQAILLNEEN